MRELCDTCAAITWETGWLTGCPIAIHPDGAREVYYECEECYAEDEDVTP